MYYKNFLMNSKPLLVTEDESDVIYIKTALKHFYKNYPTLIKFSKNTFKFAFLNNSPKTNVRKILNIDGSGSGL